jgi:hypothetical protein
MGRGLAGESLALSPALSLLVKMKGGWENVVCLLW